MGEARREARRKKRLELTEASGGSDADLDSSPEKRRERRRQKLNGEFETERKGVDSDDSVVKDRGAQRERRKQREEREERERGPRKGREGGKGKKREGRSRQG